MDKNTMTQTLGYKYKKEIARDLGISLSTLKRWLIKHELKIPRGYVSPEQQIIIHNKFETYLKTEHNKSENPHEPK